jgi:hypothetical protein
MTYSRTTDPQSKYKIQSTKGGLASFFAPLIPFRYTLALSLRCKWDFIVIIL